jgi:hypothetical protein
MADDNQGNCRPPRAGGEKLWKAVIARSDPRSVENSHGQKPGAEMLTSLALMSAGAVITWIGVYFWNHPDKYYRYLHSSSGLASMNVRPPESLVKFGAALTIVVGISVLAWELGQLIF